MTEEKEDKIATYCSARDSCLDLTEVLTEERAMKEDLEMPDKGITHLYTTGQRINLRAEDYKGGGSCYGTGPRWLEEQAAGTYGHTEVGLTGDWTAGPTVPSLVPGSLAVDPVDPSTLST